MQQNGNINEALAVFSQYSEFDALYRSTTVIAVASVRLTARCAVRAVRAALQTREYEALFGLLEVSAPPNCQPARLVEIEAGVANRLSALHLIVRDGQMRTKVTAFGAHVAAFDLYKRAE